MFLANYDRNLDLQGPKVRLRDLLEAPGASCPENRLAWFPRTLWQQHPTGSFLAFGVRLSILGRPEKGEKENEKGVRHVYSPQILFLCAGHVISSL